MNIKELKIGDKASVTKTLTQTDVYLFAGISGDLNPAHVNAEEAKNGIFGKQVVHGVLTSGLISNAIGMHLPGPGTIYMSQTLNFKKPVFFNDTITATVEVTEFIKDKFVKLSTVCTNQDGEVVIDGEAMVLPPKE
jgi:3-hydroxybutyryl-CoA dehydratase